MTAEQVRQLQSMLNGVLKPSPKLAVDGVFGPRTRTALHQLQQAKHTIPSSGTEKMVSASAPPPMVVASHGEADSWMSVAEGELGQAVIAGTQANQRIIAYHSTTGFAAKSDEVAWCSSFVNWTMKQAGYVGTGSAAAKSWMTWGKACEPRYGAIAVVRNPTVKKVDGATGSPSGYHVAFFLKKDVHHVTLLGGNQHDMVKVSRFGLGTYIIEALRWPE